MSLLKRGLLRLPCTSSSHSLKDNKEQILEGKLNHSLMEAFLFKVENSRAGAEGIKRGFVDCQKINVFKACLTFHVSQISSQKFNFIYS